MNCLYTWFRQDTGVARTLAFKVALLPPIAVPWFSSSCVLQKTLPLLFYKSRFSGLADAVSWITEQCRKATACNA